MNKRHCDLKHGSQTCGPEKKEWHKFESLKYVNERTEEVARFRKEKIQQRSKEKYLIQYYTVLDSFLGVILAIKDKVYYC